MEILHALLAIRRFLIENFDDDAIDLTTLAALGQMEYDIILALQGDVEV